MRYVIRESPDSGEKNHYFESEIMPVIGHTVGHGSRFYEVMDIEVVDPLARESAQDVRVLVRRIS